MRISIIFLLIGSLFADTPSWIKGMNNPNGRTGLISIQVPIARPFLDANVESLAIAIPTTDYATIIYTRINAFNSEWANMTPAYNKVDFLVHIPLYKLFESKWAIRDNPWN